LKKTRVERSNDSDRWERPATALPPVLTQAKEFTHGAGTDDPTATITRLHPHPDHRIHKTLRVTPAMAAGVTDKLWSIGDLVDR
jgi:hypothetical protein